MNQSDRRAVYTINKKDYVLNHFEFIDHARLVICLLLRMKSG